MTEKKTLHDFLTNLKAELRVNNRQLAKNLDIPSKTLVAIDERELELEDLTLGVYRELISLKDWDKNYVYEPFIKESDSKNLVKGFANFIQDLLKETELTLQDLAELEEGITSEFIDQAANEGIHPNQITISFMKKLLIQSGKLTKKKIDIYYFRPILESVFAPYEVTRFAELVYELREKILQVSQKDFGAQIGVSGGNVSRWERGQTNPDSIKMEHFRILANLKGWTMEHLVNYIYGHENETESFESVAAKAKKFPPLQRLTLGQELIELSKESFVFHSLEKFSKILKEYINKKNLSLEDASKKLRIKPVSRLDSLLKQKELPSNMELLRLSSLPDFLDKKGDRYSYQELKQMIYGRFTVENPEQEQ